MTTHTAEFSYPIGAFGQKKCNQIALDVGVTFKPFDKSDRKNGFQRITFTGPNVLAINGALDMLDEAVTKFNRHKAWERRMAVAKGIHATSRATHEKPTTVAKVSTKGSRFSALTLDDDDESEPATTTPQVTQKKAPKKWTPLNLSGIYSGPTRDTTRTDYSAPPVQKATPQPTKSYHEMVADWQVHQTQQQIPQLPEPPLFAQKAWHEHDMSRPMLEPCTGPIPIDEEYQTAFRAWQKEFLPDVPPTEDELLNEASEMFEKCLGILPPPSVTEDEIAGEYEQWELENDLALEIIDHAVIDRYANVGMRYVPTDHILLPNGELACLEVHATNPTALSSLPAY